MSIAIDLVSTDEDDESTSEYDFLTDDEKFARKLQKELDEETQQGRKVEEFECPICFDEKPIDSKFIYQNCEHVQCRECASEFFIRQIELKNRINCVLCQQEVAIIDLEMVISTELVNKYLKTHDIKEDHNNNNNYDESEEEEEEGEGHFPKYPIKKLVTAKKVSKPVKKVTSPPHKLVPAHRKAAIPSKAINPHKPIVHQKTVVHHKKPILPQKEVIVAKKPPSRSVVKETKEPQKLTFEEQDYIPGNLEPGRKKIKSIRPRFDPTSSDSDSYEVPLVKNRMIPFKEKETLKRKLGS